VHIHHRHTLTPICQHLLQLQSQHLNHQQLLPLLSLPYQFQIPQTQFQLFQILIRWLPDQKITFPNQKEPLMDTPYILCPKHRMSLPLPPTKNLPHLLKPPNLVTTIYDEF
jgi:hypothetical protein